MPVQQRALALVPENAQSRGGGKKQVTLFGQVVVPEKKKKHGQGKKELETKKAEVIAKKEKSKPKKQCASKMTQIGKHIIGNRHLYPQVTDKQAASIDLKATWPLALAFGWAVRS